MTRPNSDRCLGFRAKLKQGELLIGTFVKTTSHQIVEVLGQTALDFIVLDAEHAPFSPATLDVALMAARLADLPALVRVPDIRGPHIGMALDLGAMGIVAPHIRAYADADRFGRACRYRDGTRGFSNSPRAGQYGSIGMRQLITDSDAATVAIAQIEDAEALAEIDAIAGAAVDCLFIGRADLTLSCGSDDIHGELIQRHVETICASAKKAGMRLAMFIANPAEIAVFTPLGVTVFVIGSDHGLLRASVGTMLGDCKNFHKSKPES